MNHLACMACVCIVAAGFHVNVAFAGDAPKAKGAKPKIPDRVYVKMATTMGDITLELNREKAPITVKNFLDYTDSGFYEGTIFHRVINGFMIQGGGFDKAMAKKTTREGCKNEWRNGLKNKLGTIAMARLGGQPDSATSQFFINVKDNAALDTARDGAAYAVFGSVIGGMDAVNKIKLVSTKTAGGMQNVPVEPVIIKKVTRLKAEDCKALIAEARQKEMKAMDKAEAAVAGAWGQAMDLVKTHGGDPDKGQKSSTGLWHVDLVEGTGASPSKTDKVKVHYTGWLTDGKKFDSSVDRGQPFSFSLKGGVIQGWLEGVAAMKVGGKRILVIPPDLAYGAAGRPGIPRNATLVFQVELLQINP